MTKQRKPHPRADVIMAWASGLDIQYREVQCDWKDWRNDGYNKPTPPFNDTGIEWRVKPRMASINGFEFPAPVTEGMEDGEPYFVAVATLPELVDPGYWNSDGTDLMWLRRRRIHLTREAAKAHAKAEILAVGGEL